VNWRLLNNRMIMYDGWNLRSHYICYAFASREAIHRWPAGWYWQQTNYPYGSNTPHQIQLLIVSYVYWTVHHLDSRIERDQLDVTCFIISLFNAQHVSDVNTSILRSLRLICWVISWIVLLWFDVCWCYVVVWLWWCGIRTQAEAG